jgi:ATP-dependent helicase/nuclease subunit A
MSVMRNAEDKEISQKSGDLIHTINQVEKQRDDFESARLLYVAATRAETHLHLFAQVKPGKSDAFEPQAQSLLARLWPAIGESVRPALVAQLAEHGEGIVDDDSTQPPEGAQLPKVYRRLAANWTPPELPAGIESQPHDPGDPGEFIEFSWAGEDRRLTGDLVHRLLENVARQGVRQWMASGGFNRCEAWCLAQLRGKGLDYSLQQKVLESVRRAVNACLASDRGRWIVDDHAEAESEMAITAVLNGQVRSLKIDRTFVDKGERWIIDYKTSSHSGGGLETFLDNEEDRYREQLTQYRDAMALGETRPIRCALYFPLLDQFREIKLEDNG